MSQTSGDPAAQERDILPVIRSALAALSSSDGRVARAVLADPGAILHMSVSDLAAAAGTSSSTVVRACQRLGLSGFQHLKIAIAQSTAQTHDGHIAVSQKDSALETLTKTLSIAAKTVGEAASTVDAEAYEAAIGAVSRASQVLVLGVGTSMAPAQDVTYRLVTVGVNARTAQPGSSAALTARLLTRSDVCLAISHTGASKDTVKVARIARATGARVVGVTSFLHSPLAETCDHLLVAGGPDMGFRLEATTSRLAHLAVLDALVISVAFQTWDRARPALDLMADISARGSY
jgi:RpiR family carbohydrate utilization transcriptional regulator